MNQWTVNMHDKGLKLGATLFSSFFINRHPPFSVQSPNQLQKAHDHSFTQHCFFHLEVVWVLMSSFHLTLGLRLCRVVWLWQCTQAAVLGVFHSIALSPLQSSLAILLSASSLLEAMCLSIIQKCSIPF